MEGMNVNVTSTNAEVAENESVKSTEANIKSADDGKLVNNASEQNREAYEACSSFSLCHYVNSFISSSFYVRSSVI